MEMEKYCKQIYVFKKEQNLFRIALNKLVHLYKNPFNLFYYFEPGIVSTANEIISKNQIDIVQFEYTSSGQYLRFIKHRTKFLDEHDVTFITAWTRFRAQRDLFQRALAYFRWRIIQKYELDICKDAGVVFVRSMEDAQELLRNNPHLNIRSLPHGVDINYFNIKRVLAERPSLLFIGDFRHTPNVDAVLYFAEKIFPSVLKKIPCATLYVIGGSPPNCIEKLNHKNIVVTGFVNDIREYLSKCHVFVAPITWGGGVKVKILEAMASGIPVVTTSNGAYGIEAENRKDFFVADSPKEFAERIVNLIQESDLNKSVGENCKRTMTRKYNYKTIFKKLEYYYYSFVS
jgi:glycosyltransferase involved in cell wall biosynthesis